MRSEYVKNLSPEGRVKNELESLYFRVKSGDVETEELLRRGIQEAFREHDVTLHDKPSEDTLRNVMLDAYKGTTKELQGKELSPEQIQTIEQHFDSLKDNYDKFYETIFDSYEKRYKGEPVDFEADYERMIQSYRDGDPFQSLITEQDLDAMERAYNQDKQTRSGLSYAGRVPEAKTH